MFLRWPFETDEGETPTRKSPKGELGTKARQNAMKKGPADRTKSGVCAAVRANPPADLCADDASFGFRRSDALKEYTFEGVENYESGRPLRGLLRLFWGSICPGVPCGHPGLAASSARSAGFYCGSDKPLQLLHRATAPATAGTYRI